jgi:hypothetical protein
MEMHHWIPFHPAATWATHKYRLPEADKAALENMDGRLKAEIIRQISPWQPPTWFQTGTATSDMSKI